MDRTCALLLALFVFSGSGAFAGDSTGNPNPSLVVNTRAANTACANAGELAITGTSQPLRCTGGIWRYQGATGVVNYGRETFITAAEIGTIKTLYQACPAGKRPVGGGCVFFAGSSGQRAQAIIVNTVTSDFAGWQCSWGPLTSWADDPYPSGGTWAPAKAAVGVSCADY